MFHANNIFQCDIAFQRTYFRKAPANISRLYTPDAPDAPDAPTDDDEEPPIQTRTHNKNSALLKNSDTDSERQFTRVHHDA
jgi:hypothetical protein